MKINLFSKEQILLNPFKEGNKTIYFNQITGIQFKEPGRITSGYIRFLTPGSTDQLLRLGGAAADENTIVFLKKDLDLALRIKSDIEKLKLNSSKSTTDPISNDSDLIRKYKQLFDDGIITKEEFEAKKKDILGL